MTPHATPPAVPPSTPHPTLLAVTARIVQKSAATRSAYLAQIDMASHRKPGAERMGCANVAHAFAAMPDADKASVTGVGKVDNAGPTAVRASSLDKFKVVAQKGLNIGIVNAYNDMLSAHAPLQHYPDIVKTEARKHGATAQVAGGVPAM